MVLQAIPITLYCLFLYTNLNKISVFFSPLLSFFAATDFSSSGFALIAMTIAFVHKDDIVFF